MSYHLKTVNFGSGNAGLATVGYTLYNTDGTVYAARSTTGVHEVGTSTGIYLANINFPDGSDVVLLWDTGGSSPYYAGDEGANQLNSIQEGTDNIRTIWNTIKNQNEIYLKLINKIDGFKPEKMKFPLPKEYTAEFKEILSLLNDVKGKDFPSLEAIKSALKVTVNSPSVNIPETKIPDYSTSINNLSRMLMNITSEIAKIPKQQKDYTNDLLKMAVKMEGIINKLEDKGLVPERISTAMSSIITAIRESKSELNDSIASNTKLDKYVKDILMLREASGFLDNHKGNKEMDLIRLQLGL